MNAVKHGALYHHTVKFVKDQAKHRTILIVYSANPRKKEAKYLNKVIIVGRLTRDPEVRYTQTGKAVASFSVAVDNGYGENKKADFIPVVVWDKLAEVCGNNLTKGRRVLVEGRLQIRDYEKDGQKRRAADVVAQNIEFLDTKQSTTPGNIAPPAQTSNKQGPLDGLGYEIYPDEEIPF